MPYPWRGMVRFRHPGEAPDDVPDSQKSPGMFPTTFPIQVPIRVRDSQGGREVRPESSKERLRSSKSARGSPAPTRPPLTKVGREPALSAGRWRARERCVADGCDLHPEDRDVGEALERKRTPCFPIDGICQQTGELRDVKGVVTELINL